MTFPDIISFNFILTSQQFPLAYLGKYFSPFVVFPFTSIMSYLSCKHLKKKN